jgi:hypothetical protein
MLDHLREEASTSQFDEDVFVLQEKPELKPKRTLNYVMGTTAKQRFILAVMLFFVVCLLGTMFLFVTGKIVPPFLY